MLLTKTFLLMILKESKQLHTIYEKHIEKFNMQSIYLSYLKMTFYTMSYIPLPLPLGDDAERHRTPYCQESSTEMLLFAIVRSTTQYDVEVNKHTSLIN